MSTDPIPFLTAAVGLTSGGERAPTAEAVRTGSDLTWPLGVVREEPPEPSVASRCAPVTLPPPGRSEARGEGGSAFAHVISAVRRRNTSAPRQDPVAAPALPTAAVSSDALWPPVEARALLQEVSTLALTVRRGPAGHWSAEAHHGWRLRSAATHEFPSFESGRQELVVWAREHALLHSLLSPNRALVLADTGLGTHRLWQLVRQRPSLRAWILEDSGASLRALYRRLVEAAALLGAATAGSSATRLRPDLDTFGWTRERVDGWFVGFVPEPQDEVPASGEAQPFVAAELAGLLSNELAPRCRELALRVAELWLGSNPWDGVVSAAISTAFKRLAP